MTKTFITATYKSGETVRLYGYPVHANGETVGIVTGAAGRGFDGYKLDRCGNIITYYGFRARKDAFRFVEEVQP
jgi:hypothetical protein